MTAKFTWEEQRNGLLVDLAASLEREDKLIELLREMEAVLEKLAKLGNGDRYGSSVGNNLALDALAKIKEVMK